MSKRNRLNGVFEKLQEIMESYAPPFSVKKPSEALKRSGKRSYELTSFKPVIIAGRSRDEVYFAGIILQKDYVGFYFMTAYAEPGAVEKLSPDFMKLLKGKACFHIRSDEPDLLEQVRKALDLGLATYRAKGWI